MQKELDIRELRRSLPISSVNDKLADDLFLAELRYDSGMDIIKYPCRFNGYLAFYCIEGNFEIEINLKKFTVHENSLFIYTPGNLVRVLDFDPEQKNGVPFVIVAVSADLLSNTRMDINRLGDESLRLLENPCVIMTEEERALCREYFDLISDVSSLPVNGTREAITSLISSIFYLMGALWKERLAAVQRDGGTSRAQIIMEDFLVLVRDHHTKERGLAFYADKLYLTPKYLSKLIKSVSGKSAHEWIDSFVILEAKNMLKYSEMSVKSIVYSLNFPNQTTFYRFFKAKTGMTPSEYRKQ